MFNANSSSPEDKLKFVYKIKKHKLKCLNLKRFQPLFIFKVTCMLNLCATSCLVLASLVCEFFRIISPLKKSPSHIVFNTEMNPAFEIILIVKLKSNRFCRMFTKQFSQPKFGNEYLQKKSC